MDACPTPQAADPCVIVIFGASGDLTKRKLIPSLYNLGSYHLLPAHFSIIGVARRPLWMTFSEISSAKISPNLVRSQSIPISGANSRSASHIVRVHSITLRLTKSWQTL